MARDHAGLPADHGLSSLGLLMQLAGTLLATAAALLGFEALFAGTAIHSADALWLVLVLAACVVRSLVHRAAGVELLYGRRADPMSGASSRNSIDGVRRYVVVGLGHALLVTLLVAVKGDVSRWTLAGIAAGLAAWPAILAVLLRTRLFAPFVGMTTPLPVAEDKGFEGAAILMTVLGVCGVLATGAVVLVLLDQGWHVIQEGRVLLVLVVLAVLCVRSALHVQAGLSGLRTTSIERSVERANRYASFGIATALGAGGMLMLITLVSGGSVGDLFLAIGAGFLLLAWPLIVRRFFSDRHFADLIAGDSASHHRAPDAGLTSLGWLLLGHAAYRAAFVVPELFGHMPSRLDDVLGMFAALSTRSPWWTVGVLVMQAWAGYELIRMQPYHRGVGMLYAVVATAVTLYIAWPVLSTIDHLGLDRPTKTLALMPVAIALVLPIATALLVNRKVAPTAVARYRPKVN